MCTISHCDGEVLVQIHVSQINQSIWYPQIKLWNDFILLCFWQICNFKYKCQEEARELVTKVAQKYGK